MDREIEIGIEVLAMRLRLRLTLRLALRLVEIEVRVHGWRTIAGAAFPIPTAVMDGALVGGDMYEGDLRLTVSRASTAN